MPTPNHPPMWRLAEDSIFDPAHQTKYKRTDFVTGNGQTFYVEAISCAGRINFEGPAATALWERLLACCGEETPLEKEMAYALEEILDHAPWCNVNSCNCKE